MTDDWHGWGRTDDAECAQIHIGPIPGAKSIALYLQRGSKLLPCAYFKDEARAREALKALDALLERRQ